MFTRKGNSKANWARQTLPTQDSSANTQAHAQQHQAIEITQEQRAAAVDAARFPPPPMPDTTVIGKNFNLEGENIVIRCKGALSINGTVDANIHCEHLTIADSAHITGSIAADEVNIHGQVEGIINGAQVTLHTTADVEGDINAQFLSVERGARFDGRSRRVTDAAEIAPQLMAGANDEQTPTLITSQPTQDQPAHYQQPEQMQQPAPPGMLEPGHATQPATTQPGAETESEHTPGHAALRPTGTPRT